MSEHETVEALDEQRHQPPRPCRQGRSADRRCSVPRRAGRSHGARRRHRDQGQGRRGHPRRHRLVLVGLQEGRRPGSERPQVARCQRDPGLREQRRLETGRRHQRRHRREGQRDRDVRPRRERTQGPALTKAAAKGIEIITVNSGLGAFDSLKTYMVHVGQTEDVAGEGAGKQFNAAGREEPRRRHPRGEQLGPDAARGRRQEDVQRDPPRPW